MPENLIAIKSNQIQQILCSLRQKSLRRYRMGFISSLCVKCVSSLSPKPYSTNTELMARNVHSLLHVSFPIETFSIKFFMGDRKLQFAVTRLQFHIAWISNFSKAFIRRIKKASSCLKRKAVQFLVAKSLAVSHLPLDAPPAVQT